MQRDEAVSDADEAGVDWSAALEIAGGDADLLKDVVEGCLEELPQRLEELHRARQTKDLRLLQRAAHTLKGAARTFGAGRCVDVASRVEIAARQSDEAAIELVDDLRSEAERMGEALAGYVHPEKQAAAGHSA